MKKKVIIAVSILALCGIYVWFNGLPLKLLFGTVTREIKDIERICIEACVNDQGEIKEIEVDEQDVAQIGKLLKDVPVIPDEGFVFAEGRVRIRMEGTADIVYLYPYSEDVSILRVGHDGDSYIWLDSEGEENLEIILEKYIDFDAHEGIWEWNDKASASDAGSTKDIESMISKAIRVQYGWSSFKRLEDISTKEFYENAVRDEIYVGRRFYSVDSIEVEQSGANEVTVTVGVYSPDVLIHHFTLKQSEDGC